MLYIGHFSFSYDSRIGSKRAEPWHGHFTAVAEAGTIAAALRKFEALIRKSAKTDDLFDEIAEIYLDACVEVKSMPRAGFLGHVALQEGESAGGISTTLRGLDEKYATSYHLEPEEPEDAASYSPEPFVVLAKPRRAGRKSTPPSRVH